MFCLVIISLHMRMTDSGTTRCAATSQSVKSNSYGRTDDESMKILILHVNLIDLTTPRYTDDLDWTELLTPAREVSTPGRRLSLCRRSSTSSPWTCPSWSSWAAVRLVAHRQARQSDISLSFSVISHLWNI